MSARLGSAVNFPTDKVISKQTVERLVLKRSYVDRSSNLLVLVQGGKSPSATAYVPEKYVKILHIISYRYDVCFLHSST